MRLTILVAHICFAVCAVVLLRQFVTHGLVVVVCVGLGAFSWTKVTNPIFAVPYQIVFATTQHNGERILAGTIIFVEAAVVTAIVLIFIIKWKIL